MAMYELMFGYVHCLGRTEYNAGYVDSEETAIKWVDEKRQERSKRSFVPKADPICWCPVRSCHARFQKPWFSYRKVD